MNEVRFYRAETVADAISLLETHDASPVAGGTDLVLRIHEKKYEKAAVVDISGIPELKEITYTDGRLRVGACASFTEISDNALVRRYAPVLAEAAFSVGSPQIRNRGTTGGNFMNGSPAADTVPALAALDAEAVFEGPDGVRKVPVWDLFAQRGAPPLLPGEILTAFEIVPWADHEAFVKLGRRNALSISRMNISILATTDENGRIDRSRVVLGAVGLHPERAEEAEQLLIGMDKDSSFEKVETSLSERVSTLLGKRSTVAYKREAVKGIGRMAYCRLWAARKDQ